MAPESYIIRGGAQGHARLRVLAQGMAPYTNAFLDKIDISAGARALDVGCGGGAVSRELARRVGKAGRVVGIDLDAVKIGFARDEAASEGITNAEFRAADFFEDEIGGPYDLVYARFLLSHLKAPAAATARMVTAIASGNMLAIEDVDFSGHFCHPPRASFDRYVTWYKEAARRRGADARLGRRLPELFAQAGFVQIQAHALNPAALDGPIKQMAALTLAATADAIVAEGLADRGAVEDDIRDLEGAARDPSVFMSVPRVVQVWARKS